MNFGATLQPASSIKTPTWIDAACSSSAGTVGALVPTQYDAVLRIEAPEPIPDDWWSLYRELFVTVAAVGARHTSAPDRAWFAVWEGHGFANTTTHIGSFGPKTADEQRVLDADRLNARIEDHQRNTAIERALGRIPRFHRPDRTYYLLAGPLAAVATLKYPGFEDWRNPDLIWPDDRSWFLATDVDFWSLYVGGNHQFLGDLERTLAMPCQYVHSADPLPCEV